MNMQVGADRLRSGATTPNPASLTFVEGVQSVLQQTQYRRAESGDEKEAIYRLRYQAYKASSLIDELPDNSFSDAYDEKPNCRKFAVYFNDHLVSTLRIHFLTREHPYSPAMSVFPDMLGPRLDRGETFVDPSRLAADPTWTAIMSQIPFITLRLAVAATEYFEATACLAMVRDDHTAFYRRYFHAERLAAPRVYPSVTVLGHLFESNRLHNLNRTLERFPFFRSTSMERRLLFAQIADSSRVPISITPNIGAETVAV